jgi:hypothetical protein
MGGYYISGGTIFVKIENAWNQGAGSLEDNMGGLSNFTMHRAEEPFT